jgi:hypothetical protein
MIAIHPREFLLEQVPELLLCLSERCEGAPSNIDHAAFVTRI